MYLFSLSSLRRSILSTLAYHAIFEYPLTGDEIHRFLIADPPASQSDVQEAMTELVRSKRAIKNGIWYSIPSSLAKRRLLRRKISAKKLAIACQASNVIAHLPWVKMIAVTGALAMENADENDDIDLMIVTSRNRLWMVRPIVVLLISLFFRRRKPLPMSNEQKTGNNDDALCLNLWLDESALEIPKLQRNLYAAHELAQMRPIVNKDKTYERMMWENRWGRRYLANIWERLKGQQVFDLFESSGRTSGSAGQPFSPFNPFSLFNLLNLLAFRLQLWYMRPKMTNERVSLHSAFFHPGNRGQTILRLYKIALDKNKIDI